MSSCACASTHTNTLQDRGNTRAYSPRSSLSLSLSLSPSLPPFLPPSLSRVTVKLRVEERRAARQVQN